MSFIQKTNRNLEKFLPELLELRRHFHAHPELSGNEHQTAAMIAGELRRYGWQVQEGVGRTGVIAELGSTKGPIVGLRVDMDALPIEEKTNLQYASLYPGIMHACGHDLHICIGLGVARLLAENHSSLLAGVRLLFQPAEEIAQGANWMREAGCTKNLKALFGVHVYPDLPVGEIGIRSGSLTAAAGELEIHILGDGGHGARPHQSVDAIWIAARVITGLQEAISRQLDALKPVVISFGKIQGGKAFNVISDKVQLLGTVRCLDPAMHQSLPSWIKKIVTSIATDFGAKAEVSYRSVAPPVYNDPSLTDLIEKSSISVLGKEKVNRLANPSLGAEDFAEFLQDVPGSMFRLGVAGENGCFPLHHGQFSLDERSLEVGIEVLFQTLCSWIKENSN